MKKLSIAIVLVLLSLSCTKEPTTPQNTNVTPTELEALKAEIAELKSRVDALTPAEQGGSASEIAAIKKDIEELKEKATELQAKVESVTTTFFDVEGLRFDKNGTLISTPKLQSVTTENKSVAGVSVTLTTTRTLDDNGRLVKERFQYSNVSSVYKQGLPFIWKEISYEYNGKECKTTTQTNKYGLPPDVAYEEEVTDVTYW